jgi:putative ABC transport system permease protein
MDGFLLDVRSAWRAAWRRPTLTGLTILTLVLGIGANTAIFAVARGVLLRPLPYQDPDSLVMIWQSSDSPGSSRGIATPGMLREYRARASAFTDIAAVELWRGNQSAQVDLVGPDGAERLRGSLATPNFFSLLGVNAAIGRTFVDNDEGGTVVLSDALWRRRFGADPAIVGQTVDLASGRGRSRQRFQVIGVLPARFRFTYPEDTELWLPLPWAGVASATQAALQYSLVGRLKPGINVETANGDLAAVVASLRADVPRMYDRLNPWVESAHEWSVGRVRPAVRLIAGVTLLLLLIACLNVASLLLAQAAARRREFALQQSLGASRARLIRQLLTESAMFTAVSVVAAILLVAVLQQAIRAILPPLMPRVDEIAIDFTTVAWTTGIGALTLLLAGLLPGWRSTRIDPQAELMLGGRTTSGGRAAARLRQGLTVLQISAASLLLIGGTMLLQSLWNLQHVDLGFDGTSVLTQEIRLMGPAYREGTNQLAFQDRLLERVRQIPGVRAAATTSAIPLRGVDFRLQLPVPGANERVLANRRHVDPEYFNLMRIPLVRGRLLTVADNGAAARVAVVSEALARAMFADGQALGQHLPYQVMAPTGPPRQITQTMEIVGVVGDVRSLRVEDAGGPAFYVPYAQMPSDLICLVIRADAGADHIAAAVRSAIREIDPNQPAALMTTVGDVVAQTIADRRFYAVATVAFALIALVLTVAGLYGVMVIGAAERLRELGIRVALGATRRALVAMLLRQGLGPVILGALFGGLVAAWAVQFITSYLFGVAQVGAPIYLSVTVLVTIGGLIACLFPARRASMADPMEALRSE